MAEIVLTDQNFDKEIQESDKPVLVDFWATWCAPCNILSPILEKLAQEYEDKLVLAKVNVDEAQLVAGRYGINQIPTVVLFSKGKPVSGFIGARPEPAVKELLDKMLADSNKGEEEVVEVKRTEKPAETTEAKNEPKETEEKSEEDQYEQKTINQMIEWYENYAAKNGLRLNPDRKIVEGLMKGLLANERKYGARYCPCRRVTGNLEEDRPKICPCKWHKEEFERDGHCHCGLFVK